MRNNPRDPDALVLQLNGLRCGTSPTNVGVDNPTLRFVFHGAGHRERYVLGLNQCEQLPDLLLQPEVVGALVLRNACVLYTRPMKQPCPKIVNNWAWERVLPRHGWTAPCLWQTCARRGASTESGTGHKCDP